MYRGQIIDTHMHIWETSHGQAWLSQIADGKLNYNFTIQDYLEMSRQQSISQMVYIECGAFSHDPVLETKWVQKQADRFGGPQAIIAYAKLDSNDLDSLLKAHTQFPNVRGIRMPLNYVAGCFGADRDDYMTDDKWCKGFSKLADYQLLFEMQIFDQQIQQACKIAKTYPDTQIVLEHLGWPVEGTLAYFDTWKKNLAAIAQFQNVVIKLSCLGWIFKTCEEEVIIKYVKEAVRLFGVDRCIVGSNCPPDRIYLSFDQIFYILKKALASYSEFENQKIFYGNAKRIYRL
jgi:predicted TIM-barrel fold metal-dependent hydrolase